MKPDWEDAPGWAKYLALDLGGEWNWFECEPSPGVTIWYRDEGRSQTAGFECWFKTLEKRPE